MRRLWTYPVSAIVLFAVGYLAWSNGSGARAIVCSAPEPQVLTVVETVVETQTIVVTQTPQPAIDCGNLVANVRVNVPQGFLNIRPQPSTEFAPIGILAEGELLKVLDISNPDWLLVRLGDLEGWVYRRYVSEPECASG